MEFRRWRGFCLCSLGGAFPSDAVPTEAPFDPLVLLTDRPPETSRGLFAVRTVDEAMSEGVSALVPAAPVDVPQELRTAVERWGATVLNTAFCRAFDCLKAERKTDGLRLTLVGLGDVGGTLLTVLKLPPL